MNNYKYGLIEYDVQHYTNIPLSLTMLDVIKDLLRPLNKDHSCYTFQTQVLGWPGDVV